MNNFFKQRLVGIAGISLLAFWQSVLPAYAIEAKTPNLYELKGQNLYITYSTSSIDGKASFDYQDKQQKLHFIGEQIRTQDVGIGQLVSVTIRRTVDTGSTDFSLLIPSVNLGQKNQVEIITNGITTLQRFSTIPKFSIGQTQTYTINRLIGTAKAVEFIRK